MLQRRRGLEWLNNFSRITELEVKKLGFEPTFVWWTLPLCLPRRGSSVQAILYLVNCWYAAFWKSFFQLTRPWGRRAGNSPLTHPCRRPEIWPHYGSQSTGEGSVCQKGTCSLPSTHHRILVTDRVGSSLVRVSGGLSPDPLGWNEQCPWPLGAARIRRKLTWRGPAERCSEGQPDDFLLMQ